MTTTELSIKLLEWRNTGHAFKLIAADIAEWADGRERGRVLPDDSRWGYDASPTTCRKAKNLLVAEGILNKDDGRFQVALQGARPGGS